MSGQGTRKGRLAARNALFLWSLGLGPLLAIGCANPSPTELEDESDTPGLILALDTLNVEVQSLWVRISAVPTVRQDLLLKWQLEAETANPFWQPRVMKNDGSKLFDLPDTARIWGNVPRAYDFRLIAWGLTDGGDSVVDTLQVHAPLCPDPERPNLLCNIAQVGSGARRHDDRP